MHQSEFGLQCDVPGEGISEEWRTTVADQARTLEELLHQIRTAVVRILVILLPCVLLAGCTSSRTHRTRFRPYISAIYAPTSEVDVLSVVPLRHAYTAIGEISLRVKKIHTQQAVFLFSEKAKQIGADAIILMGKRSRRLSVVSIGQIMGVLSKEIYAIAIMLIV
jgi:hypothetical protein